VTKTTVRTELVIACPPEAIARVLLDPDLATQWTSDLERFEVVRREPGEVGSIARLHYNEDGRRYVMEDRLLRVEPNRRYLSQVTGEALTAEVETVLEPVQGGTRLHLRWTGSGRSLLFRLMLPFLRGRIAAQMDKDLTKLKDLVESLG
jgi:uncharacterized protein YndB with AHSA1/START domain